VKYCDIVHVLDVTLLEVSVDTELFPQEVQRIEGFGLCLSDGWYLGVSWQLAEAHEITPSVLEGNTFWRILGGGVMEQQGSLCILLLGILLKSGLDCVRRMNMLR
jgi:hypothetical protein